jgi:hypothetical protein
MCDPHRKTAGTLKSCVIADRNMTARSMTGKKKSPAEPGL